MIKLPFRLPMKFRISGVVVNQIRGFGVAVIHIEGFYSDMIEEWGQPNTVSPQAPGEATGVVICSWDVAFGISLSAVIDMADFERLSGGG